MAMDPYFLSLVDMEGEENQPGLVAGGSEPLNYLN
jgi:hypothetical protein